MYHKKGWRNLFMGVSYIFGIGIQAVNDKRLLEPTLRSAQKYAETHSSSFYYDYDYIVCPFWCVDGPNYGINRPYTSYDVQQATSTIKQSIKDLKVQPTLKLLHGTFDFGLYDDFGLKPYSSEHLGIFHWCPRGKPDANIIPEILRSKGNSFTRSNCQRMIGGEGALQFWDILQFHGWPILLGEERPIHRYEPRLPRTILGLEIRLKGGMSPEEIMQVTAQAHLGIAEVSVTLLGGANLSDLFMMFWKSE